MKTRMWKIYNFDAACKYHLNMQDLAILDWIYQFAFSGKMKSKVITDPATGEQTRYFWLFYQAMLDDFWNEKYSFTVIGIKNRQVLSRRIHELVDKGILGFYLENHFAYHDETERKGSFSMISINYSIYSELADKNLEELMTLDYDKLQKEKEKRADEARLHLAKLVEEFETKKAIPTAPKPDSQPPHDSKVLTKTNTLKDKMTDMYRSSIEDNENILERERYRIMLTYKIPGIKSDKIKKETLQGLKIIDAILKSGDNGSMESYIEYTVRRVKGFENVRNMQGYILSIIDNSENFESYLEYLKDGGD